MFDLKPDVLINAFIKAIGLNPEQTRAQLAYLQNWVIEGMKGMNARVHSMEDDRATMHAKLDRILILLGEQNDGRNEPANAEFGSELYFDGDNGRIGAANGVNGSHASSGNAEHSDSGK
jgi:hypothetical protein